MGRSEKCWWRGKRGCRFSGRGAFIKFLNCLVVVIGLAFGPSRYSMSILGGRHDDGSREVFLVSPTVVVAVDKL